MRVLITGFESYWDYPENSSWVVAEKVATHDLYDIYIGIEQMPVSYTRVGKALRGAVEKHNPDIIIMLGQSGGSDRIKLERVALNMKDSKGADNDGYIPDEEPINISAPAALFTTMPIKELCVAVEKQGVPIKISNSCGLYVCNNLYYEALMLCREKNMMQALFVHIPFYEGQSSARENQPTMPLDSMVKAIQTIIYKINDKSRKL